MSGARPFLTAEWRSLLMLNYEVNPAVLQPLLPRGTELDLYENRALASMVGFLFLRTRVRGWPVPFHQNFEEVNLRFYVRYKTSNGWQRGVVFCKEIVPRWAIAAVARVAYNEKYVALPMRHEVNDAAVRFEWHRTEWEFLGAEPEGPWQAMTTGSEAHFIAEHYWGYTAQRDGGCVQYQVEHVPWRVRAVRQPQFCCDVASLYGTEFVESLTAPPRSVFLYEGSPITVYQGTRL